MEKTDSTSTVLIGLAAALLALSAVIGTVVVINVVNNLPLLTDWVSRHGIEDSKVAVEQFKMENGAAIGITVVVIGSLVTSAAMLLGFVLLRGRQNMRGTA